MFSTRIMATSCCRYSFATCCCCCCCCCCCYELERDLSLDARRPTILSLASISSLVYTARLRAMQRKECTPRDENQKKKTTTPRAASSSSSFVVFPRAQTGTRNFFLVRVGACEFKGKKEEFFWHYWGGVGPFHFLFPLFFFVICILDVSVSLPTQNERLFVKARLCDFCGGRRRF